MTSEKCRAFLKELSLRIILLISLHLKHVSTPCPEFFTSTHGGPCLYPTAKPWWRLLATEPIKCCRRSCRDSDKTANSMTADVQRCVCLCGNLGDTKEYCVWGGDFARSSWPLMNVTGCCECPTAAPSPLSTDRCSPDVP